ncbi:MULTISPECIES: DUF4229 domain-containing protein [unclassified Curtobacterium]|uniref:DUF4229 domain-containing protein n=1 Tax=unclassified Curtobacterium TaxID=257496 RepID=UPI0008DC8689|nr:MULTISPECIES: DUF4229 domain-containing protein [unclassified Curtobacterium]OIH93148.1 hypothetical protein BIU92_09870 [Curtobacterium sp. MCBA15_003]OII10615.1 hypothetical protein BIU97_10935 [Curtobacterium sp. MCBA15_009]OII30059.1 hypothetical protein BIU94_10605 [Curtobacterium sp. MMLR14_006]
MKAWLLYTLARLGIFAAALVLLLALTPMPWYWATIVAALVGLLVSYIALARLRTQVATSLANRRTAPAADADSDFEDGVVDASAADQRFAPEVRPVSDADRHAARKDDGAR